MAKKQKYLKQVTVGGADKFKAVYTNKEVSSSHDAARFFMTMEDKGQTPEQVLAYAKIGPVVDPQHDWTEIKRIAETFAGR